MERILYNGVIHAGEKQKRTCSAVYIKNGVIMALGNDTEILQKKTEHVQTEDLGGKHVFPGFIDSHMHLLETAQQDSLIHLDKAKSFDDVVRLCREKLQSAKESHKWICGISFNQDDWDVKLIPTRKDLDRISCDVPVTIRRVCLHVSVCNTKAMELMGVSRQVPEELEEFFDKDEAGVPNGIIREAAQTIISDAQTSLTKEETKELIKAGCLRAAAKGITEIQTDDFHSSKDDGELIIAAYRELAEKDELPVRIYQQNYLPDKESLQRFLARGHYTGETFGLFRLGPLKVIMDGSLGSHSAYMRTPYLNDPETRGLCYHEKEELYQLCRLAHDSGMQIAAHCIGDGALADILEVYAKIQRENPRADCRHGVVHCQIMDDEQTEAFRKLDLIGYIQPIFLRCDMNIVDDCVGTQMGRQSYNWRRFIDLGVHISGGSDSPVESFDVLPNLQYAVTRKNPDTGKSWYPENSLTLDEAMQIFTWEGAYASFAERTRGSIEAGKEADLTILSEDPAAVDIDCLREIQVLETVVKGRTVFTVE